MIPYRAVTIYGLDQAVLVLGQARPVALLSAADAASYAGCGWWRALVQAARQRHPLTETLDILDCGDAPGRAVEALRIGCAMLVLDPACAAFPAVAAIASQSGARLLEKRPPSLDIGVAGATARLRDWLAG